MVIKKNTLTRRSNKVLYFGERNKYFTIVSHDIDYPFIGIF